MRIRPRRTMVRWPHSAVSRKEGATVSASGAKRAIVVGSSFAGLTGALELRKRLDTRHEVVVLDPHANFTFIPSLIWLPFGLRQPEDITFALAPTYARARASASSTRRRVSFDLDARTLVDQRRAGTRLRRAAAGDRAAPGVREGPGPGPRRRPHAVGVQPRPRTARPREAWNRFLENPGPVVVGTAQGGSCFGASYEFLFNTHHRIKKAGLQDVAPVTFVTAEPFLGHFGLGGVRTRSSASRSSSTTSASRASRTTSSARCATARWSWTAAASCRSRSR